MANVAIIQGANGGLGQAFVSHLLRTTGMEVIATTRDPNALISNLTNTYPLLNTNRLKVYEMDLLREDSIQSVANSVEKEFGKKCIRLLLNVSGVLHADRSITSVKMEEILHQYQINTFGHLLTYKHFIPLLPSKSDVRKFRETEAEDFSYGAIKEGLSVVGSLTARVGSIGDNKIGGWIGYRSSKSATNQIIATLQRELLMKSTPAIAVSLHPGTVPGTTLSSKFTKITDAGKKPGYFTTDESSRLLLEVIKGLKEEDGGKFLDWKGEQIPW